MQALCRDSTQQLRLTASRQGKASSLQTAQVAQGGGGDTVLGQYWTGCTVIWLSTEEESLKRLFSCPWDNHQLFIQLLNSLIQKMLHYTGMHLWIRMRKGVSLGNPFFSSSRLCCGSIITGNLTIYNATCGLRRKIIRGKVLFIISKLQHQLHTSCLGPGQQRSN